MDNLAAQVRTDPAALSGEVIQSQPGDSDQEGYQSGKAVFDHLPGAACAGADVERFSNALVHGNVGERFAEDSVVDRP